MRDYGVRVVMVHALCTCGMIVACSCLRCGCARVFDVCACLWCSCGVPVLVVCAYLWCARARGDVDEYEITTLDCGDEVDEEVNEGLME